MIFQFYFSDQLQYFDQWFYEIHGHKNVGKQCKKIPLNDNNLVG